MVPHALIALRGPTAALVIDAELAHAPAVRTRAAVVRVHRCGGHHAEVRALVQGGVVIPPRIRLVHVAEREGIDTVFTLDRRDFSVYRLPRGKQFTIVP